ncbi:hypothetical protein TKK_0010808 [Trichogramma kaykai]
MSKLTLVFAAVAVLMLGDLCSAAENLPGQDSGEVKRAWLPIFHKRREDDQHNLEDKRSWFPEDYKRSLWYPLFHKRSVGDQHNLKDKRSWFPEEHKRSWFPEDYKRSSWYPLLHKRSEDDPRNLKESKRVYLEKRSVGDQQNLEDKRNWWTHDFYKRTPYHIIKRLWPFNAYVKPKRAGINLNFSK